MIILAGYHRVQHHTSITTYFHSNPYPISATDAVDLECESSIGNVFATILECEAEFDLVDIQCTIDGAALENCKLKLTLGLN